MAVQKWAGEMLDAAKTGELPAWLYKRVFVSALPRARGYVALRFFRALYPDFSFGPGARCAGKLLVLMEKGSSITVGAGLFAVSDIRRAGIALYSPCKLRTMASARLTIGDNVTLNGTSITCRERIEIGDGTMIAANVTIMDSDFHQQWPPVERANNAAAGKHDPVRIGRNVWIGTGSIILKGSSIGDNSIIGAGSVVTGTIPSNVMAAGVPAKVVHQLGL